MIPSSKPLWGEGLFLRPQHFQRQDAYHEWRLVQTSRALHPYAWGVRSIKVDTDALAAGQLRLVEVQALFPDGEIYNAPFEDELPPPLQLDASPEPADAAGIVFHLAMAPLKANGGNQGGNAEEAGLAMRYHQHHEPAADWFTRAASAEVCTLRKSVRLVASSQPHDHLSHIGALRIRRSTTGSFELDTRFLPPSVSIAASPLLVLGLRRLMDVLQAKADALMGMQREPSRNIVEFRSGDVASFWLLHTAGSSYAALTHLLRHPGLHPERLFEELLRLAGALMTFSKSFTLADLPAYDHRDPGPGFARLDHIVRELLETVISTRYFAITLAEAKPSFHTGRLEAGQVHAGSALFLGVSAALPPAELVDVVPLRVKIGAPDDVDKLVLSAMPGVRLIASQQVPAAIPVRPGTYYFSLEPRGALYERMLQAQSVCVYAPAGLPDLGLELIAVNP